METKYELRKCESTYVVIVWIELFVFEKLKIKERNTLTSRFHISFL